MFEWDQNKADHNLLKHNISFAEASTAFSDPKGLDGPDVLHSGEEIRFLRIEKTISGHILTIAIR